MARNNNKSNAGNHLYNCKLIISIDLSFRHRDSDHTKNFNESTHANILFHHVYNTDLYHVVQLNQTSIFNKQFCLKHRLHYDRDRLRIRIKL